MRCPYCGYQNMTNIEFLNGINSYIIIIIIFLLSGFVISIFSAPIAFILTKTLVHRCVVCQKKLGTDGKLFFYLPYKDSVFIINKFIKIISFKFGEFGFVMTKNIVIGIFLTIFCIFLIYFQIGFEF